MRLGLSQYLTQPVTLVSLLVVSFGVLAALVKFLSDLVSLIKNARNLRGSPEGHAAPSGERKAFVPGQRPRPASTVLTSAAHLGVGLGLGSILVRDHEGHLPHDHGHGDAGHPLVDADGGHAALQPDGHPLADLDDHDHGLWDAVGEFLHSLTDW